MHQNTAGADLKAAAPNCIAVTLVQWSNPESQALAFGWTVVRDATSAEAVARMIDLTPRLVGGGGTAISDAIDFSIRLLDGVAATGVAARGGGGHHRERPPHPQR
ncbi:MAG: DUF1194 domain-containing protein, partial [Alphaproteobacteria bacterium]